MKDYMYIISNELGFIKVGISKDPQKRLKQLQTGNEHVLTLLFTEEFSCSRNHLLHIEKEIHNKLKTIHQKASGEWFYIEKDNLDSIKNLIIYYRIRYEDDLSHFNRQFI